MTAFVAVRGAGSNDKIIKNLQILVLQIVVIAYQYLQLYLQNYLGKSSKLVCCYLSALLIIFTKMTSSHRTWASSTMRLQEVHKNGTLWLNFSNTREQVLRLVKGNPTKCTPRQRGICNAARRHLSYFTHLFFPQFLARLLHWVCHPRERPLLRKRYHPLRRSEARKRKSTKAFIANLSY